MEEIILKNANDVINELTKLASNKNYVYRGFGKQSELYPNLIRKKDYSNREIELLSNFEKYGMQYCSVNNLIDFMSCGQHFGLPTRLLDFTFNPFVALFFAIYMPKGNNYSYDDDKNYYYIRYCNINDQILFNSLPLFLTIEDNCFKSDSYTFQCIKGIETINYIVKSLEEEYKEGDYTIGKIIMYCKSVYNATHYNYSMPDINMLHGFINELIEKIHTRKILFIDANQCNNRIVMQQGLFMFPYDLNKESHLEIIEQNTNLIKIHKSTRNELQKYLSTIGIDSFRLMPDLQSVCGAIKRNVIDERNAGTIFAN